MKLDRLDAGASYERYLLNGDPSYRSLLRGNTHGTIELALDYAHAGLFDEAIDLLNEAPADDPMVKYYQGWCYCLSDDDFRARACFELAAQMPRDYCFPNRIECVAALETAMRANPSDAHAPYYLGNFWYAKRQYDEAIDCWKQALELDEATRPRIATLAWL